jgi:hypothetical protein
MRIGISGWVGNGDGVIVIGMKVEVGTGVG